MILSGFVDHFVAGFVDQFVAGCVDQFVDLVVEVFVEQFGITGRPRRLPASAS